MSNLRIKLNSAGVRELLKSKEMQQVCKEQAEQIKNRCGDGYASDTYVGRNRTNAMVWAETSKARAENMQNNKLLKALK